MLIDFIRVYTIILSFVLACSPFSSLGLHIIWSSAPVFDGSGTLVVFFR
jgi:hypothetical protein